MKESLFWVTLFNGFVIGWSLCTLFQGIFGRRR